MAVFSTIMLALITTQIKLPVYDSGAPSPRIIPGVVLTGILIASICLIVQSLVFKKEKIYVFDIKKELPAIILILMMCVFTALILTVGFIAAVIIVFPCMLWYMGERKPFIYIFTLVAGVGVYYLFLLVLNISLPGFGG